MFQFNPISFNTIFTLFKRLQTLPPPPPQSWKQNTTKVVVLIKIGTHNKKLGEKGQEIIDKKKCEHKRNE